MAQRAYDKEELAEILAWLSSFLHTVLETVFAYLIIKSTNAKQGGSKE